MSAVWRVGRPEKRGWALVYYRETFMCDANGVLFPAPWLEKQDLPVSQVLPLGWFEDQPVELVVLSSPSLLPECNWQRLRHFMLNGEEHTFQMLAYAAQIGGWWDKYRFCGQCGSATTLKSGAHVRHCAGCELDFYPQLSPSMIVLVTHEDRILLARSPHYQPGFYSTLAGYVEPGESVEQCVRREVMEEVGVEITDIQYLGSQNWPFPHSLMLGYQARYVSGEIRPQEGEIEDARWFSLDDLPILPAPRSIARYLIERYRAERLGLPEPMLPG